MFSRFALRRPATWIVASLVGLALVGVAAVFLFRGLVPAVTEEDVRTSVLTTIQREAPASFYVTGTLDISATVTVANTKRFLPGLLDLDLGTTQATLRVPGRVAYGFDVRALGPEQIRLTDDGVVEVWLPELSVFSAEPDLARLEVQTDVGWARTYEGSGRAAEQRGLRHLQNALRVQGEAHLRDSRQPRLNTAEALERLLEPVLVAAGLDDPQFRFRIGPTVVVPEG